MFRLLSTVSALAIAALLPLQLEGQRRFPEATRRDDPPAVDFTEEELRRALPEWILEDPEYNVPRTETQRSWALAEWYHEQGHLKRALRYYANVYEQDAVSALAPEALFRRGEVLLKQGEIEDAFTAFNTIALRYPGYPHFNAVIDRQYNIALAMLDADARYLGVIPFKPYERAIGYLEQVVRNAPYTDFAPQALMQAGLAHREHGNDFMAIDAFDRIVNFYPSSAVVEIAYLELGKIFEDLGSGPEYDQGATKEAIKYYQDYLLQYPDSPYVGQGEEALERMEDSFAQSKLLMGDFYYRHRNNIEAASVFYNEAITISPESDSAEEARERLAMIEEGKRFDTRILPRIVNLIMFRGSESVEQLEQKEAEYNQPGASPLPEQPTEDEVGDG